MENLSEVSEYLRNLEEMFKDSWDSLEHLESMFEERKMDLEKIEVVGENQACEPRKNKVVVFTRAPPKEEFDSPFMRFAKPCGVEGVKAWDAQLNMEYGDKYITEDVLEKLG